MSQEVMNTLVDMSQEIIRLKDQNRQLLVALKDIANDINDLLSSGGSSPLKSGTTLKARAAIAKAEGEKA